MIGKIKGFIVLYSYSKKVITSSCRLTGTFEFLKKLRYYIFPKLDLLPNYFNLILVRIIGIDNFTN